MISLFSSQSWSADPQGSALDWSEQRIHKVLPRLFAVLGLARDALHVEAPEIARDVHHVLIDGSPRIAALMRSAMLAADVVVVPAQPPPFGEWTSDEIVRLIAEARILRPRLVARLALNHCGARTVIPRQTALALTSHDPRILAARVGQCVVFADAARSGRLVSEVSHGASAVREIDAPAAEIDLIAR